MKKNNGLIVSFYLNDGAAEGQIQTEKSKFPFLSWSPYDRIGMKEVNRFGDFFRSQFQESWNGTAQQIHLIPEYPKEILWEFNEAKENNDSYLIKAKEDEFGLNCIITVRFQEAIVGKKLYRDTIYQKIQRIVDEEFRTNDGSCSIEWSAFISLGSEDVVFIVLANDIHSFARFINILKQSKILYKKGINKSLLGSISSFAGFNRNVWSGNPRANLHIRLILRPLAELDGKEFLKKIKQELPNGAFEHLLLGNNIFDVKFEASDDLLNLFHDQGPFNGNSQFYEKYISSSRSYWEITDNDSIGTFEIEVEENKEQSSTVDSDCGRINYNSEEIGKLKTPMAQFILQEFQRMISFKESNAWKHILENQYVVVLKLIQEYSENSQNELIYSLIKQTQNVLLHIKQATSPIAQIPYRNYTYAGSYNDILKMYYGIISNLLQLGYSLPHDPETMQYEIIFSVDFESTEKVHSTMYCSSDRAYSKRFVVFHLPFDAFIDIRTTVYLLTHEVFHYIAPYDREERNKMIIQMWGKGIFLRIMDDLRKGFQVENKRALEITEKLIEDSSVFDNIYLNVKNRISTINSFVTNEFFEDSCNLQLFNQFDSQSCDIFLEELKKSDKELFVEIYQRKYSALPDDEAMQTLMSDIRKYIKTDRAYHYNMCNLKTISRALKEAFCDINMIQIYQLDLADYLEFFFERYLSQYIKKDEETMIDLFKCILTEMKVSSFEKRLGIVFDYLEGFAEKEKAFISHKEKVENIIRDYCGEIKSFPAFLQYCIKCYSTYLNYDRYYREAHEKLFYSNMMSWREVYNDSNAVVKLRDVKKLDDDIVRNAEFISSYLHIENPVVQKVMNRKTAKKYERTKKSWIASNPYRRGMAHSLGEYIDKICKIANEMKKDSKRNSSGYDECCWYRGFCSDKFTLLPNLFRGNLVADSKLSPYALQTKKLKEAYLATLSMPDLWTEKYQGIPEHVCCLQHYGMKTNLLDFSLNMLVALHFALNPDNKEDRDKLDRGRFVPKVVVFNPVRYSKAVQCLKEERYFTDGEQEIISTMMFASSTEELEEFFVTDLSAEYSGKTTKKMMEEKYVPNRRVDKYPKPIIIRHSNDRIKAQGGTFVAFNLFSCMDHTKSTGVFDYLELENIQKDYLDLLPREGLEGKEKFLEEIYIDPVCIDDIRRELKVLGVVSPKMYPELNKIFMSREESSL